MRLWAGQWQDAGGAEPAIAPRTGAITMTAPQVPYGTIIWGGVGIDGRLLNDGVMVDRSGYTRLLPAAPICPRRDFAWADDHFGDLVIYGGYDQAGTPLNDGAVCSSDPGTWTLLASSPLPPGTAVMAGDVNDMAVLARDLATGLPTMAHLRRNQGDSGRWELVPAVPLPKGDRYDIVACCGDWPYFHSQWVDVLSEQPGGFAVAARYSMAWPTEGTWTQLGQVPLAPGPGGGPVSGHATEQDLTAWLRSSGVPYPSTDLTGPYGVLTRTGHTEGPWQLTGPAPQAALGDPSLVLSPGHLISVQAMAAYDLLTGRWLRIPKRGLAPRFGAPTGATAWWDDGKLWLYGGRAPDGSMESRIWVFTPRLPPGSVVLPTDGTPQSGKGCVLYAEHGRWTLRGDPTDPMVAWLQSGSHRMPTSWPDGWVARFTPRLKVIASDGQVMARAGDVCSIQNGAGG